MSRRGAARVERWREAGGDPGALPPAVRARMESVFAASGFVADAAVREPALLAELARDGLLDGPRPAGAIAALATAAAGEDDEAAFMAALRRLRRRELARIAWRDLAGDAPLPEVLRELSALADAAIRAALGFARRAMAPRYGTPRGADGVAQELVVVAMGKLGGGELNFSSDVDLVFLYPEAGATDGRRAVDNEEYFTRLGQSLIRLLDAPTPEGFVFRVDMRLRPLGESGPLVVNFEAFEEYLQKHGRDWERYAWVKARAVCGEGAYRALYADVVRPFVYRRYLDFGVYESLREMKSMIAREVARRELQDDVKLGPGGIREIEFVVQAQQLIRGGAETGLQSPSLLEALPRLAGAKRLPAKAVSELQAAYEFLRRVENRLQMAADEQTHRLPADAEGRAGLAESMGFDSREAFDARLREVRAAVTARFDAEVLGPDARHAAPGAALDSLWSASPDADRLERELQAIGLEAAGEAARMLMELRSSSYYRRLDEYGRRRLAKLAPRMLAEVARAAGGPGAPAAAVLARMLRIVEAIGGRTAYLALLYENAEALARLVRLCGMGDYLPRQVAAHPLLLDELLDSRVFESLPDRAQFEAELAARIQNAGGDEERQVDALRHFRRAAVFRVATLDLTGRLPLMQVSDRLTDVAELTVEQALALAWARTVATHGEPRCRDGSADRAVRVAIAGYGKLGGMELGYGSDLDLVFLHDATPEPLPTAGAKPVDNEVFFLRLAQRLVHLLTVHTPAGRLYEVDVRLRPGGKGGLAFTRLGAFEEYQRREAWTWEHQALLHSRWVAGDPGPGAGFERIRREVLMHAVRRDTLREDIRAMRERMRAEHGGTPGRFDLKQDRGGIADIEFLAQYWVLRWVREQPALAEYSDTIRHLESVGSAALVDHAVIDRLVDAYRRYRSAVHHLSLEQRPAQADPAEFAPLSAAVAAVWEQVMVAGEDLPPV